MKLTKVINSINNLDYNEPLMMHNKGIGGEHFYLVKRNGTVYHEDSALYKIKGITVQVDDDWDVYGLNFVGPGGMMLHKEELENKNIGSKVIFSLGEKSIIQYLKKIDQWKKGVNFDNKWELWNKTIDSYINNKLK